MINMHFDVFISVLLVMYRLQMYAFPYHYSALMTLHVVLHVDTVLVAVALMIMTLLGPSSDLGRHIRHLVIVGELVSFRLQVSNKILKFMKLFVDWFRAGRHEFVERGGGESSDFGIFES